MVTVELSTLAKNGKWMTRRIVCLRPHLNEDILMDDETFHVRSVAVQAEESIVLACVTHGSGKCLSEKTLRGMGFSPLGSAK